MMKTRLFLIVWLLWCPSVFAQNAGGKGFDPVAQAAFDRARDIERISGEIARLLRPYQRGEQAPLTTAVRRFVERSVQEQLRVPYRTGSTLLWRLSRSGLLEEAREFKFKDTYDRPCAPEGRVGAWSPMQPRGEICFDPPVLAEAFYEENMRRMTVPTADRLLAAAIHELAHNLGQRHGEELKGLTYLVAHTAHKGWAPSNVTKPDQWTVNLSVSPLAYVHFGADSDPCLKSVKLNGKEVPRGTSSLIPFGIDWDPRSESWFTPGHVTLQAVTFKVELDFDGDRPGTNGGCGINVRFTDSEGNPFFAYQGMVANVPGRLGDPWTLKLTQ
ncbi:MAG TPA: hypothetical protein VM598_12975 [Bdellovibrionota bacterium]|nr:hypothetical protein [Bdellovibrionota bacterium]